MWLVEGYEGGVGGDVFVGGLEEEGGEVAAVGDCEGGGGMLVLRVSWWGWECAYQSRCTSRA